MSNRDANNNNYECLAFYIDLDRYPIHDVDSRAGQALIVKSHEMMARDTLSMLEGFLRGPAVFALAGRLEEFKGMTDKAIALSPRDPMLWALTGVHAFTCVLAEENDGALLMGSKDYAKPLLNRLLAPRSPVCSQRESRSIR
ncbi:MAG: hypothetical protein OES26_13875 [Gammaproteobacteria bacterium]|nr:hypothetical protein [Gammaproteobacteria bacterium]